MLSQSVMSGLPESAVDDRYLAGHLGALTAYLPPELVEAVLAETGRLQQRLRLLPSLCGVYFVLALSLFPHLGMALVWEKLVHAWGTQATRPTPAALRHLRARLGPTPLRALFEVLAVPLAPPGTPGVGYRGLRTVAFDGCHSLHVPDTVDNRAWLGRVRTRLGWAGYPALNVMTLVDTGTRGLLGASIGENRRQCDERDLARTLLHRLTTGMLVMLDRGFDANDFLSQIHATGADFLVRMTIRRTPRAHTTLSDGSYLSTFGTLTVRIVNARFTLTGPDGKILEHDYRLATTLLDPVRHPAADVARLYHERWEIETAYREIRATTRAGRPLRSGHRAGLEQELWAMLICHQLLRMAIIDALPGLDPDRGCYTAALEAARASITTGPLAEDRPNPVHHAVQRHQLPPRRARISARRVKHPTSRYIACDRALPRPRASTPVIEFHVTIQPPPAPPPPRSLHIRRPGTQPAQPGTRRARLTALMHTRPDHLWTVAELTTGLGDTGRGLRTQLTEWATLGFLERPKQGHYRLSPTLLTEKPEP